MKFPFTLADKPALIDRLGNLNWQEIGEFLNGIKPGTRMCIEVKRESRPKSKGQLGYYHAVILPIATKELKRKSLEPHNNTILEFHVESVKGGDKKIELPITTACVDVMLKLIHANATGGYKGLSEMDMDECRLFEDWCIRWLAEHKEIFIPLADKDWRKNEQ